MKMARKTVLLIAEAANPNWVSVPLVGWNIAMALRNEANVHIVTQVRNKDAFLDCHMKEGADFTAIDTEALAAPIFKLANLFRGGEGKGWTTLTAFQSLSYPYFEHLVWKMFGQRIKSGEYDLVHRVTPLSPTSPSSLAAKCKRAGVPFLLGPLNGGLPWPSGYTKERVKEKEWLSFIRNAYGLLPLVRSTYRNASAIIAASTHTMAELGPYRRPTIYIPENGIDTELFHSDLRSPAAGEPLRAVFVGRLVPYKGCDIAIEGSAELLRSGKLTLDLIGDGPEMPSLREIVRRLGLQESVTFHGWQSQTEVANSLAAADLFIFPSVREFGGGVVLEAMASGAVPIVIDYGGPGELVDDSSGFRLKIAQRPELVGALKALLVSVCSDKYDLRTMALAAQSRAREMYAWEKKAAQIAQVYHWLCKPDGLPPNFKFLDVESKA